MTLALQLDSTEARVLGVLIEKELTTPEQYPLSLHALTAGCNQKSNRDPVLSLSEHEVSQAILRLRVAQLVEFVQLTGQRVEKYRHRAGATLHLEPAQVAVLAELLLRGAQQPGELRSRVERMHALPTLEALQAVLDGMATRGLVARLEREPGERAARFAQLLAPGPSRPSAAGSAPAAARSAAPGSALPSGGAAGGAFAGAASGGAAPAGPGGGTGAEPALAARVALLEAEVARLGGLVRTLATRLGETVEPD